MEELENKIKMLEAEILKYKSPLNALNIKITPKNKIDRLEKFITSYSELTFPVEKRLLPSHKPILLYYLHKGISDEVLEMILEDNPTTDKNGNEKPLTKNHLHTINKKLRDRGYLIRDEKNYQKFKLTPELETIRKKVMDEDCKLIIITC